MNNTAINNAQQALNDLHWVLTSPLLAIHSDYSPDIPQVDLTSVTPGNLLAALASQKSHFLGPYFESLWKYAIEQSRNLELIYHGLQVRRNNRTLGEFDFILRNKRNNRLVHQEIAVKYYLGVPLPSTQYPDQSAWFGPNSIDRLDLKLAKLLDQQVHLSDHPESQAHLTDLNLGQPVKQMLLKGYLFQPMGESLLLPPYGNPDATPGEWLSFDQLEELGKLCNQWQILPKLHWLSPAQCPESKVLSFREMATELQQHQGRPQLIAAMKPVAGDSGNQVTELSAKNSGELSYKESHRYFVVSEHWRSHALASLETNLLSSYA